MTDLLTARIVPLEQLLLLGTFRPASVQRDFQWDEFRAERLLREVIDARRAVDKRIFPSPDADSEPDTTPSAAADDGEEGLPSGVSETGAEPPKAIAAFYLGVMVLSPAEAKTYDIFDGLQRLTTLTILICVLRDLVKDAALKQRLHTLVAADTGAFRLTHAGRDTTLASMIQKPGEAGIRRQNRSRPANQSARHVFDVARRFVVLLNRRSQEELAAIAAFLLDRVLVGIVATRDQRLARHIFVATNLYGLPLRRDEVFKGQILALARSPEELDRLEGIWNGVRDTVGQATLEEFLVTFDAIWRRQPQGADCLGDLVDHLAKTPGEVVAFTQALTTYANAWKELEGYLKSPTGGPIGNHIWRLAFFRWKEWKPLALHWLERHLALHGDARHRNRTLWRFAELNRRCMAISLYDFGEELRAEMFLKALHLALRKRPEEPFSDRINSRRPLDFSRKVRGRVRDALTLPIEDYEVRRSLILWYEALLWEKNLAPGYVLGGTVEHILPDKPDLQSRWMQDFPDVAERYSMHSSIGNLALVDGPVNRDVGNKDFVHKKAIFRSKDQFGRYKSLADIEDADAWTADTIRKRALTMAPRIWAELNLPHGDLGQPAAGKA